MNEIEKELVRLSVSGAVMAALPELEDMLAGLEQKVITQAMTSLARMEPMDALALWHELCAYRRIRNRLTSAVKSGQSASENLEPYMNQGEE